MTRDEIRIAQALRMVTFLPGSADKRFARAMEAHAHRHALEPLTEKQSAYLQQLAWKYRRQLPAEIAELGAKPERENIQ